MAYWIDRALIWLLAAFSSLLFFLVITDGRLILSVSSAFACTLLLRVFLHKLPDKRLFCRQERLRHINQLLENWAMADEKEALSELRRLLPDLFEENEWPAVQMLQRMPGGEAFSDNDLLAIHRENRSKKALSLLCTGPVSPSVRSLLARLNNPSVRLISSRQLSHLLLKSRCPLSAAPTEKERRRLFSIRIAQLVHSIRPVRSAAYAFVFFALYLWTQNAFYLVSALFFFMQLMICFIIRMISARKPA